MRSCEMKSITIVKSLVFSDGVIILAKVEVLLAHFLVVLIQPVPDLVRRITSRTGLSELLLDSLSLCMAERAAGGRIHHWAQPERVFSCNTE